MGFFKNIKELFVDSPEDKRMNARFWRGVSQGLSNPDADPKDFKNGGFFGLDPLTKMFQEIFTEARQLYRLRYVFEGDMNQKYNEILRNEVEKNYATLIPKMDEYDETLTLLERNRDTFNDAVFHGVDFYKLTEDESRKMVEFWIKYNRQKWKLVMAKAYGNI